jgi:2-polyprenyl-3-methyl-5-hydroxy-6-metoxy-1,4-benzoquinol methylase
VSLLIPPRSSRPELIDQPGQAAEVLEPALREIQWVNRHLAGWQVLRSCLPQLLQPIPMEQPVSVLDLGTGSADLPLAMARWGRAQGRSVRITAVDISAPILDFARREIGAESRVQLLQADMRRLPFPLRSFDLVTCSLFLHHFDPTGAVELLRIMARHARHAILVNDLHRHRIPYWSIRVIARLRRCSPMFRHDAPLSVLRAYRPAELQDLLRVAGLTDCRVVRHFPYRLAALGRVQNGTS